MSISILLVDEGRTLSDRVNLALERAFDVRRVANLVEVPNQQFAVLVAAPDGMGALGVCEEARARGIANDVVLLGTHPSLRDAIAAIRAGASDFVPNGDDADAVVSCIRAVIERRQLSLELDRLQAGAPSSTPFPELLGESSVMQRLRERLSRVVHSDVTALITGESGSGKEVVARALHTHGPRKRGPFVAVSCSAIPRHLMESEFFGHVKGAFTDAATNRTGLLSQASGGTIFFDEIADMPLDLQAKLLRALQQRAVRPLGQRHELPFDARVIAASRSDLEAAAAAGNFREDLFFRLNVIPLRIPPLRERERDVLILARHFIQTSATSTRRVRGLTPAAARALLAHDWPGNVRELEHCIAAAIAAAHYDHIRAVDLNLPSANTPSVSEATELVPLSEVEQAHIMSVLDSVSGNKAQAARLLGLDRKTLYRKLKQYEAPSPRARFESHPE